VGVVGEVRRWADGVGLAAVFGVGLVSGVFGVGGALVPLVMGLPLKVACSEAAIALGDAAARVAAGIVRLVVLLLSRLRRDLR
jgi:uncharacterized membrane protein YfcA